MKKDIPTRPTEHTVEVVEEEGRVFEKEQLAQVQHKTRQQECLSRPSIHGEGEDMVEGHLDQ